MDAVLDAPAYANAGNVVMPGRKTKTSAMRTMDTEQDLDTPPTEYVQSVYAKWVSSIA